jgi:CRP-like cAMP-binding protein
VWLSTVRGQTIRSINGKTVNNRLLLAMAPDRLDQLIEHLEPVPLAVGQVLGRAQEPLQRLYFVNRGFVSMVKTMRDGRCVEVGGVGIEGLTASRAVLGVRTAVLDWIVQIPGDAFAVRCEVLEREVEAAPGFLRLLINYMQSALGQIVQTAACNRLHSLEERCCRWMLVASDNALADRFVLTHEFLAAMLGLQRPTVSAAASALRSAGLIDYARGVVTIRDRAALEARACECYAEARRP